MRSANGKGKWELNRFADFNVAAPTSDFAFNPRSALPKDQIHTGVANSEIVNANFAKDRWQAGAGETNLRLAVPDRNA